MSDPASTRDLDDTDEWIMELHETPLRSIEDIVNDREPAWVEPVLALGMQREPRPPKLFTGPRWWRPWKWLLWNFGDFIIRERKHDAEQSGGRHRLVPGVQEALVYRPGQGQSRSSATSPT